MASRPIMAWHIVMDIFIGAHSLDYGTIGAHARSIHFRIMDVYATSSLNGCNRLRSVLVVPRGNKEILFSVEQF